jgi:hypothetical protein
MVYSKIRNSCRQMFKFKAKNILLNSLPSALSHSSSDLHIYQSDSSLVAVVAAASSSSFKVTAAAEEPKSRPALEPNKKPEETANGRENNESNENLRKSPSIKEATSWQSQPLTDKEVVKSIKRDLDEIVKYFEYDYDFYKKSPKNLGGDQLVIVKYANAGSSTGVGYFILASESRSALIRSLPVYNRIKSNAHKFDCEKMKANGYRSVLEAFKQALRRFYGVVRRLNEQKNCLSYRKQKSHLKEFKSWSRLLQKFEIILSTALEMQQMSLNSAKKDHKISLFIDADSNENFNLEMAFFKLTAIHSEAFFGRTCGFQFTESVQLTVTGIAVAMASLYDGYKTFNQNKFCRDSSLLLKRTSSPFLSRSVTSCSESNNNSDESNTKLNSLSSIGRGTKSLVSSTKYFANTELRGKQIENIMKAVDLGFYKDFWELTESSFVHVNATGRKLFEMINPIRERLFFSIIKANLNLVDLKRNLANKTPINVLKAILFNGSLRLPRVSSFCRPKKQHQHVTKRQFVWVTPPAHADPNDYVRVRILSNELRKGMVKK